MKKIVIITAIVLVVACLFGVLVACSSTKGLTFKKAEIGVDYTPKMTVASSNVSEVSDLARWSYDWNENGILVVATKYVEDANHYALYNVKTATTLISDTTDEINTYSNGTNAFYTRSAKDVLTQKYRTTLYDAKGTEIKYLDAASAEQGAFISQNVPEVNHVTLDVYSFADNYFRVTEDGDGVERIGRKSDLVSFNYNFSDDYNFNDKYYYQIQGNRAYIFDKSLNLVTAHYVTGDYDSLRIYVMENGNLLVQTTLELMDEDKNYTYIYEGKKYEMKTYIVDAEDGDVTEKKFEYRIGNFVSASALKGEGITVDAENVAYLYPIEDERLSMNNNDCMVVSITNKLKVKGRFDQMINGQIPGSAFETVNGYLIYRTAAGNKLVKTNGEEVGYIAYETKNDSFFSKNGKFYNFELAMIFDYNTEGYSIVRWMNNSVILSKVVEDKTYYYRFDTSMTTPKQITTSTTNYHNISNYIYAISTVVDAKTVYTYYNEKDEVLSALPSTALVTLRANNADEECAIFTASIYSPEQDAWFTHFYRVGK